MFYSQSYSKELPSSYMSKIYIFLIVSIVTILPVFFSGDLALEYKIKMTISGLLLVISSAWFYKFKIGKIYTVFAALLWALNLSTSFFFYKEHDIGFSSTIAETVINTNSSEAAGMLSYNKYYILFFIFMSLTYYLSVRWLSFYTSNKQGKYGLILLTGFLPLIFIDYYAIDKNQKNNLIATEHFFMGTPFYNASAMVRSLHDVRQIKKIANININYKYQKNDTDIETYILIIGESTRRDHMQIYGYQHRNTPNLVNQKNNILLFTQAISPAPVTLLSVPISLSNIQYEQLNDKSYYADNIISLANHAGFKTFWFSNQGKAGKSTSLISAIAHKSQNSRWQNTITYDEDLLPYLDKALQEKGKKLIVLHLYGSHEPACNRFPEKRLQHYSDNQDDNCYDSSIAYTDSIIGNIINKVDQQKASILYFSDHALQRIDNNGDIRYHHGVNKTKKEAYQIPLLIWYSDKINQQKRKVGNIDHPVSTANNYFLISDWLGIIHKEHKQICYSALRTCFNGNTPIRVLDGNKNILDYQQLPSEKNIILNAQSSK